MQRHVAERAGQPDLRAGRQGLQGALEVATLPHSGRDDKLIFASDYPHWDGMFPYVVATIRGRTDISAASKQKLLGDNAKRLYGWE